jgi:ElaB/YqjD/DUF883 family membrane-anchored ribosome-binding protein
MVAESIRAEKRNITMATNEFNNPNGTRQNDPASQGVVGRLGDAADSTKEKISDLASTASDKVSELSSTASEKISGLSTAASEKLSGLGTAASEKMSGLKSTASEKISDLGSTTSGQIDGSPLIALGAGVALGAVLAAILPASQREKDLFGPLGGKITDAGSDVVDRARDLGKQKFDELAGDKVRDFLGTDNGGPSRI